MGLRMGTLLRKGHHSNANLGKHKAGDQDFLDTFSNSVTVEWTKLGQSKFITGLLNTHCTHAACYVRGCHTYSFIYSSPKWVHLLTRMKIRSLCVKRWWHKACTQAGPHWDFPVTSPLLPRKQSGLMTEITSKHPFHPWTWLGGSQVQ